MKESFLHFLWQYGLFDTNRLETTDGKSVLIEFRGMPNRNSGPDFSEARMRISGTAWAGHVEIHVSSSEWYDHGHQHDPAYDSTVLHVVYQCDREVYRTDGSLIPCLELKGRIPAGYLNRWEQLNASMAAVPCSAHHPAGFETALLSMRHRALAARLLEKSERVLELAGDTVNDWEEVLYRLMARYLGHKVNTGAMELLSQSLPLAILRRHFGELQQLEALLFGQAGFLTGNCGDEYARSLKREYRYLAHKYDLRPMNVSAWKFGRLRPGNFPTVRIAQLASLLHQSGNKLHAVLAVPGTEIIRSFPEIVASQYWDTRYRFTEPGKHRPKHLGTDTMNGLIINAIVPAIFAYGHYRGLPELREKALDLLSDLPAEDNLVTRYMQSLGFANLNAYDSQSLLGLKQLYCDKRQCLSCSIGQRILRGEEKLRVISEAA